jgi:hypothetical protein
VVILCFVDVRALPSQCKYRSLLHILYMTSVYVDLEDVETAVSDYIIGLIPVKQFDTQEVDEPGRGPVLNSKTSWDVVPLWGDLCKIVADKFMVARVTDHGAQVFVHAAALSPTQLIGLFNLIVGVVQPAWVNGLPGSPLPKLHFDSTYSTVEEHTRFSLEDVGRFCQVPINKVKSDFRKI